MLEQQTHNAMMTILAVVVFGTMWLTIFGTPTSEGFLHSLSDTVVEQSEARVDKF